MKILKIVGITILLLLVLAVLFYVYASHNLNERLQKEYSVALTEFDIPTDSSSILKGKHLVDIKGCADCHGENLGGKIFNDDIMVGKLAGPNLTRGEGGIPKDYSTTDWVKALRHGIKRNNKPLIVMPSEETSKMSQEDLQAMIAYLKSIPPVNNKMPESKLGLLITSMVCLDKISVIPAEKIDHRAALVKSVDRSSPKVYGKYLATMCAGCHRENMKGGDPLAPGFPPVPDLTSTGTTGRWTQSQFNATLRTGKRPDGTTLDPNMPWQMTKHYSDEELQALYTYFKSL